MELFSRTKAPRVTLGKGGFTDAGAEEAATGTADTAAALLEETWSRRMVCKFTRWSGPTMRLVFRPVNLTLSPCTLSGCASNLIPETVSESHLAKSLNRTSSVVANLFSARLPVKLTSGAPGSGDA